MFASATLPRSAGSSIRSVLSSQSTHFKSTGNGLDDDKDPRDVSNNSFNRFDPKYISIGPKAVRGNNNLNVVAASTANKCATLRHVGRYGGSLKTNVSPNLRSAKTPSIATVSKDYCQQPDCIPQQQYTTEVIVPQATQTQPLPPPAPLPPPKPKAANTFTEIPGTTGVGSSYAKEHQHFLQKQQLLLLQQQQQLQIQQQQQLQQQNQILQQQQHQQKIVPLSSQQQSSHPSYHAQTTHVLPPSAVYSIETSNQYQQTQQQQQQVVVQQPPTRSSAIEQNRLQPQPQSQPQPQQRSPNLASIINQPLPEIPQSAQQQTKISQQPLSAANLNQYRSLQRPQAQKVQLSVSASQAMQQPPLPPKNRQRVTTRDQQASVNMQTLPPKSQVLRQQQSASISYEREHERERERERDHERERKERHERSKRSEFLDNAHGMISTAGPCPYEIENIRRERSYEASHHMAQQQQQSYQHQQKNNVVTTPNNNYYHSTASNKHHQQQQQQSQLQHQQQQHQQYVLDAQQQQNVYYRSLKRGGSHANSDLYSVTEL